MKTTSNPLLEEIWAIKDQLSAEAGGDIHVFFEQFRAWSAANPHPGLVVNDVSELRALLAKREEQEPLFVQEMPPKYGGHLSYHPCEDSRAMIIKILRIFVRLSTPCGGQCNA